jgi:hypothetical protein
MEGLEPPRLAAPDPKSGAATNYATSGCNFPSYRNWFAKKERKFIDNSELKKCLSLFKYGSFKNFIPIFKVVNSSQNPFLLNRTQIERLKLSESDDGN